MGFEHGSLGMVCNHQARVGRADNFVAHLYLQLQKIEALHMLAYYITQEAIKKTCDYPVLAEETLQKI